MSPPITNNSNRRLSRRDGKTLLELSIVVAMISVLMMLSAVTLAALFRIKIQMTGDTAQDVSVARLASHLRSDAHAATLATVDDGCTLALADGRVIRYAFAAPAITREVRRGETLEHRDAFVLPRRAKATFSATAAEKGQLLRLSITPAELPSRSAAVPARPIELVAAVNLHRQAAESGGTP